jgi:hypothetical protein
MLEEELPLLSATSHEIRFSKLFKIANVFVRLDHVARFIVNANHSVM